MGSMLWATDMILNDMLRPMNNAYQFKDYPTAANFLYQLAEFLQGYGEGFEDFEKPPKVAEQTKDARARAYSGARFMNDSKKYYEKYAPLVMKRIGIYIKDVLDRIDRTNHPFGE